MTATIRGLQELQDRNLRTIAALQPKSALGRAIQFAATELHRYIVSITHVDTGAYRSSHRIQVGEGRGRVFVAPSARNPRSKALVAEYAEHEEARGGSHAVYERAASEMGDQALSRGIQYLQGQLPL
jgi:hypothetical protein